MAARSGSGKKAGNKRGNSAGEKDRAIADLKDRVALLEKELQSWRDRSSSPMIAELKKADPALDVAADFRGSVLDALPTNIAVLDRNGVIVYVNKSWSRFAGQNGAAPEYAAGVGINYLDVCSSATGANSGEAPQALEGLRAVFRGDLESFELEYPCHSPDVKRWFQMHVLPFNGDRYRGILVYHNDVTKRKLAELALRDSEEKFRQMAENIGEVFFIFSPDWKHTIYVSPAYEQVWGRPLKDVYRDSMNWLDGVHPDDRGLPLAVVNRNIGGDVPGTDKVEFRVMRPDGSVRWIFARTFPIRGEQGELTGITGIAEDITERKQAEEELRKLTRVVEESPAIVITTDARGDIDYVNPQFTKTTGYTLEEVRGKNPRILKSGFTSQEEYKRLWDMILSGREWRGEFHNKKKNGDLYWESAVITPIMDARGGITGFMALKEDITERKKAERALTDAKGQAELYLDLMGHDINNMHQIALGYLELARDMMPHKDDQTEFLDKPIEVLQRSAQLIKNVRKLQKLQDGAFQTQDVDVCRLLVDVQREFGTVPHKAITLNLNGCERCYIRANDLLHDVFANLVSNAIKHTGDRADIEISLDVVNEEGGKYCRVRVDDNGPGIPDDFKARIFNRELKGDSKTKGMGIGLYLVKSLVDSYDGRVWVEDRVPGDHTKGARFVVLLPVIGS